MLLGTLVDISRLDAGVLTPDIAPFSVAQLLDVLAEECRQMAGARGLALRYVASSAWVASDLALLARVIRNLMSNAVRYTPDEGSIHVRWWREDDAACFAVADTGPGIEAEHIPRLTERFYRVDPGRKSSSGGTGLGLAIVKHCLEHHEGELDIASTPGEGSTFTCRFPAQRALDRRAA